MKKAIAEQTWSLCQNRVNTARINWDFSWTKQQRKPKHFPRFYNFISNQSYLERYECTGTCHFTNISPGKVFNIYNIDMYVGWTPFWNCTNHLGHSRLAINTAWHSTYWINQCVLGHGAIWRQSWPLVQSLSIHKSNCLRYLSFYKTHLFIYSSHFQLWPSHVAPNLTGHRTFNAGALIGVAISCHHWILHQLVRDRAAEILRVCHQPLHLQKKTRLEHWFLAKLEFPGGFGVFVVLSSCEECQFSAANRLSCVNQRRVTVKKGILLFLFSSAHAFLRYVCYPESHIEKNPQPDVCRCKVTSNPRPCALSPLWSLLSLSFQSVALEVSTFLFPIKAFLKVSAMVLFMTFVFFFFKSTEISFPY